MRHCWQRLMLWLGGYELTVLIGLLVVVGGTWAYVGLAGSVVKGKTQAFDEQIVRSMRKANDLESPIGPKWMVEIGRDITALGGYSFLTLLTLAVVGYLRLDRRRAAMWFVVGATLSGFLVGMGLKALVSRPRPDIVSHLSQANLTSFPSGHSMMSAVVYLTLGALLAQFTPKRRLKSFFLSVALLLTLLVGMSRVYMGVHYPTDVLAGWTAGLVWATLCLLLAKRLQRRGKIKGEPL